MVKPNEGARQMQVVLYARVSSERQDVDLSISAQLKALREYAARHGYTVVREFVDEAESAKSADRPKFQEMVALGRRKPAPFQAILVWKLSRFARNREDSILYKSLLRKHGIQVISINEPVEDSPTGRMLEGMIEVIDEFYSANLAQDVLRGMREAASRGYWVSATTPFGYRRIKVHDSGRQRVKLEIEPAAAPIVQRMFRLAASSTGVKDIAKQLNADGIASPKGKRWGKGAVHAMLTSQVYSGVLVWEAASQNPIRVADAIPALVDKAMFDAVQAGLKARSPKIVPPRQVSSPNLLTGLLQCGTCHAAMTCVTAKSGQFRYYVCATANRIGRQACPEKAVPKEVIEAQVLKKVSDLILREAHVTELVRRTNEELSTSVTQLKERLTAIDAQTSDIEGRLARLYDTLETGKLTLEDLAPRIRELRKRQEIVQRARSEVLEATEEAHVTLVDRKQVLEYLKDFGLLLEEGTIIERRMLLKSFIQTVTKEGNQVTIEYTLPIKAEKTTLSNGEVLPLVQSGGPEEIRTPDLFNAIEARYQLRHWPTGKRQQENYTRGHVLPARQRRLALCYSIPR